MTRTAVWAAASVAFGLMTLARAADADGVPDSVSATVEQTTRLAAVVPPGMSPQEACAGFDSLRACAATLHASQNLNISFASLKSKVTSGEKLGAAIHSLKPSADRRREEQRAESQAHRDTLSAPAPPHAHR
ncbi:MAG: hypothetical protein JO361_05430 [Gammaproteobacteria bacterium]|nr:hypothetical protein [Gammaproteobacteria bacterium]